MGISVFSSFSLVLLFLLSLEVGESRAAQSRYNNGVYIVYMGAASSTNGSLRDDHAKLLSSLFRRKADALVHTYKHGFSGFAARLSEEEARSVAQRPGVVSVFPDPILELHTTHSWDFLKYQTSVKIDSLPKSTKKTDSNSSSSDGYDTIIGILDTGIWPEAASFNDNGIGEIPSRWNGTCINGHNFNSSNKYQLSINSNLQFHWNSKQEYKQDRHIRCRRW